MSQVTKKKQMESTIKIDYSSAVNQPVIKIITPKELNEDSDVRDKLLSQFLHDPVLADRNVLFSLAEHFDLKSPFKLTTIKALDYFTMIDEIKNILLFRIMDRDSVSESREFYDMIPVSDGVQKSPPDYDKFIKVVEFFKWVQDQPYIENR